MGATECHSTIDFLNRTGSEGIDPIPRIQTWSVKKRSGDPLSALSRRYRGVLKTTYSRVRDQGSGEFLMACIC
jgi:hypothetical protein